MTHVLSTHKKKEKKERREKKMEGRGGWEEKGKEMKEKKN